MKITYKFVTGETMKIEVSDEIGTVILNSRRKEHADNERHRYHTEFSLDDAVYEGSAFSASGSDPVETILKKERAEECEAKLSQLTAVQRRRYEMQYGDMMTVADIARAEHASFNSVKESLRSAQKKLDKKK